MHDALHDALNAGYALLVGICVFIFERRYDSYKSLQAAKEKSRRDELDAIRAECRSEIAELRDELAGNAPKRKANGIHSDHIRDVDRSSSSGNRSRNVAGRADDDKE